MSKCEFTICNGVDFRKRGGTRLIQAPTPPLDAKSRATYSPKPTLSEATDLIATSHRHFSQVYLDEDMSICLKTSLSCDVEYQSKRYKPTVNWAHVGGTSTFQDSTNHIFHRQCLNRDVFASKPTLLISL